MTMNPPRWKVITPSQYPWEQEALDFVREGLPDHDPYHAWSNFEFVTSEGAIYEVDLLVLTKQGFWLVEIKSRPGRVGGDAGTWTWETEGRTVSVDNPLLLANRKAKALAGLLKRQSRCFKKSRCPFLEAAIFLSAEDLKCDLQGAARARVFLRDRPADGERPARAGILQALINRKGPGLDSTPRSTIDRPAARAVAQALDAVGIRRSPKRRRVADYLLGKSIDEGPGYQDFVGEHANVKGVYARVRRYLIAEAASEEDRQRLRRAAIREFRTLQTLDHPGILAVRNYKVDEFGPVLLFHHEKEAIGFDEYLTTQGHRLDYDQKLGFLRQLADSVRYAHRKKIIHRALSPKSVIVFQPQEHEPVLKVCYWQVSTREGSSTAYTGTQHVEELIEAPYLVYAAPESRLGEERVTEAADVFSLGAIAYHIFSGRRPANNRTELSRTLREGKGLDLSAVLDGAGRELQELVRRATHPDVYVRFGTVDEFLEQLERVEDELTTPEDLATPLAARKGDRLLNDLTVEKVLGRGSTARALLVTRRDPKAGDDETTRQYVLKVALKPEDNARLRDEGKVIRKLRSEYIVGFVDELEFGDLVGLLLETAGDQTLAEYLRQEGSLSLDLLERFGDNLLSALGYLERKGQRHRDIKPENIGVIDYQKKRKQLVLFDFSLARAPLESIHVGTIEYLDPFLPLRPTAPGKKPLWDESAERYAAAVTLHELATGVRPRWGDGKSSPTETDAELVIETEQLDASVRESLAAFFHKALNRDVQERFANAEDMLRAWRAAFEIETVKTEPAVQSELPLEFAAEDVRLDMAVAHLGLSTRAENALDRVNIVKVRDLLAMPVRELRFMRGVGKKTLSEILSLLAKLKEKFPDVEAAAPRTKTAVDTPSVTLEELYRRVVGKLRDKRDATRFEVRRILLGDHSDYYFGAQEWPTQSEVASCVDVTAGRVAQLVGQERSRWLKDTGLTAIRNDLAQEILSSGGVLTIPEIVDGLLALRQCDETSDATNRRYASGLARAAIEAEQALSEPRMRIHRQRERVYVATSSELVRWASQLGKEADSIAGSDPLLASTRAVQRLRAIPAPPLPEEVTPPDDSRLLQIAVRASSTAALSPRQEIYPRGMEAERALRLGAGAVRALGLRAQETFTPDDIALRIAARYPEAARLPNPPELTELLRHIGLELDWDASRRVYRRKRVPGATTSGSTLLPRHPTARGTESAPFRPELASARQFEEQLQYRHRTGSFLILTVRPTEMTQCEAELLRRFDLERVSLDEQIIAKMREVAREKRVDWERVRAADRASRDSRDWTNLLTLADWAVSRLREEILSKEGAVLLVCPGLLARYEQIGLLESLRDEVGAEGHVRTCWVLVPTDEQSDLPVLDGKEIPLLSPGQRARVPSEWIGNLHRAAAEVS